MASISRKGIVVGAVAGFLAAGIGIGLAGCQTASAQPEPVVYEQSHTTSRYAEQAAQHARERFAGRPADRIVEDLAREVAEILELYGGRPADRIAEEIAEQRASNAQRFSGRPVDRIVEELERDADGR